ncbi:MAG TPA: CbiX/SirB N-terminal domain-containing protein [Gammaproteobacteria bacterium]
MPVILLCDNGSTQPGATLQLRRLAQQLSEQSGQTIHPVSLQHANRIAANEIDGKPAQVFSEFMQQQLSAGVTEFILLPVFFGKSKALTSFVPDEADKLRQQYGDFSLQLAEVIYPLPEGEPLLVDIIHDHIQQTAAQHNLPLQNLVLVDHGSPIPRVTEVRQDLTQRVQSRLADGTRLEQAVMERREGKEYDFNGDLLEHWLSQKAEVGANTALVIMMFFLPGRHAGENGDIVQICDSVMQQHPGFKVAISPLIAEHPAFVNILQLRLQEALEKA